MEPESERELELQPEPVSAPSRFRDRIDKKVRLVQDFRERKVPVTGRTEKRPCVRRQRIVEFECSSDEEEEEEEPEDLIERTKQRYNKAK